MRVVRYNKGLLNYDKDNISFFRNSWKDIYLIHDMNEETNKLRLFRVFGTSFKKDVYCSSDLIEVDLIITAIGVCIIL